MEGLGGVFVDDGEEGFSGLGFCGVGGGVEGAGVEVDGDDGGSGEVAGEDHAVGDGFEEIVSADVGDGGVVGVWVGGWVSVFGEDDGVAGEGASEGVGDKLAVASVKIDACVAGAGELEQVVGGPEGGGEDVRDTGLAAVVASVAFGHAVGDGAVLSGGEARGGGGDVGGEVVDAGVGLQEPGDVDVGVCRGTAEVVVVAEAGYGRRVGCGEQASDDGGVPVGAIGGVGQAEAGVRDAGADGVGEDEPVVVVLVGGPGGGVAEADFEHVGLVADLEVFELVAEGPGDEGGFVSGTLGGVGAEVDAVEAGPSGSVEEGLEIGDGKRCDLVGEFERLLAEVGLGVQDDVGGQRGARAGGGCPEADV